VCWFGQIILRTSYISLLFVTKQISSLYLTGALLTRDLRYHANDSGVCCAAIALNRPTDPHPKLIAISVNSYLMFITRKKDQV